MVIENLFNERSNILNRRTLLKAVPGIAVAAATSPLWLPRSPASALSKENYDWSNSDVRLFGNTVMATYDYGTKRFAEIWSEDSKDLLYWTGLESAPLVSEDVNDLSTLIAVVKSTSDDVKYELSTANDYDAHGRRLLGAPSLPETGVPGAPSNVWARGGLKSTWHLQFREYSDVSFTQTWTVVDFYDSNLNTWRRRVIHEGSLSGIAAIRAAMTTIQEAVSQLTLLGIVGGSGMAFVGMMAMGGAKAALTGGVSIAFDVAALAVVGISAFYWYNRYRNAMNRVVDIIALADSTYDSDSTNTDEMPDWLDMV